jgi:hypothetical protein
MFSPNLAPVNPDSFKPASRKPAHMTMIMTFSRLF